MAKKKKDQLGIVGFASAILRNTAQQRSLKKARDAKNAPPPPPREKKPRDTRTAEQIRGEVDATRDALVGTVDGIKYDLDVPARARDLRDRVAAELPDEWKGESRARAVAAVILATGLSLIGTTLVARVRRP